MKILLATGIYPPEIGGPAGYVRGLARALKELGHQPTVVTYGDERTLRNDGWPVTAVLRRGGPLLRYARYAYQVWKNARQNDLVFLQGPVSEGLPGTIGAILAGKKTVMKVVGDYAWEIYQQKEKQPELLEAFLTRRHDGSIGLLERIERWTARRASKVIVPSRYLKTVVERWGVPSERIQVIYNGVDPLPQVESRDVLRQRFEIQEKKVWLTAVRAVPWKGVDFLLDVLARLPSEILLVIAGDGPCLEDWKNKAQSLMLNDRVRYLGRVDRRVLTEWYVATDGFLLASGYEGFPHVVAEAVSVGLPCLVSDQGGNPETKELFPQHVTVLPYRNVEAWLSAMNQPLMRLAPREGQSYSGMVESTVDVIFKVCPSI